MTGKSLMEVLKDDRFAAGAGAEIIELRKGYAKVRMLVTEKHLNGGGVCQGGAIFTMADLAFAAVANNNPNVTLTLNAHISFLKAVSKGYLYAEAVEVFSHTKVPFIEVRITDSGNDLVAVVTGTGYRKRQEWNFEE